MKNSTVLLIDDEEDIRGALSEILEEEGYKVLMASNGKEGLNALKQNPDIIILDLMMPVMNGAEFIMERNLDPDFNHIPVIVMSADRRSAEVSKELKANAHVRKPLNLSDLLEAIQTLAPNREAV